MSAIMLPFSSRSSAPSPPGVVPGYSSRLWDCSPKATGWSKKNTFKNSSGRGLWGQPQYKLWWTLATGWKPQKCVNVNESEREIKETGWRKSVFSITSQHSMSNAALRFRRAARHLVSSPLLSPQEPALPAPATAQVTWAVPKCVANYAPKYWSLNAQEVLKAEQSELTGTLTLI